MVKKNKHNKINWSNRKIKVNTHYRVKVKKGGDSFQTKVAKLDKLLEQNKIYKEFLNARKERNQGLNAFKVLLKDKKKNKKLLAISKRLVNRCFVNKYIFDLNRMNQSLYFNPKHKSLKFRLKEFKSNYYRFDYYLFEKRNKKKIKCGLPQLLRFSRQKIHSLHNVRSLHIINNINYDLLFYLKKGKSNDIYSRFFQKSKQIYQKDLLKYFWIWKLLTLYNKSVDKSINLLSSNFTNTLSKLYFDMNNYFLIKNYFKIYKNYYIRLFRIKRNLNFKVYHRLSNKLFMRNLFWKYYRKVFFDKYRKNYYKGKVKGIQNWKQLYTSRNIGVINVVISLNNTFVTLSDLKGNVLFNAWGGILGIKGNKRATPTASEAIARKVGLVAKEKEIKYIYLKLNGVLYTRKMKSAIKGFLTVTDLKVLRVINLTPKAHNGIRRKKMKKV